MNRYYLKEIYVSSSPYTFWTVSRFSKVIVFGLANGARSRLLTLLSSTLALCASVHSLLLHSRIGVLDWAKKRVSNGKIEEPRSKFHYQRYTISTMNPCRTICNCQYDPRRERLEYDYNYDETAKGKPQPMPRIRERGEYYVDSWNGQPWSCSFGTNEEVSEMRGLLWRLLFLFMFSLYRLTVEWNLDEFRWSSRDNYGCACLVAHVVFRLDGDAADKDGRNSRYTRHDLLCALLSGLSISCQDFIYRSRICSKSSRPLWSTTAISQ